MGPLLRRSLAIAILGTSVSTAQSAPVDMLGDTLVFARAFPSPTTPYTVWAPVSVTTTVVAGSGDAINWPVSGFRTIIDPEANSIDFRFPISSRFDGALPSVFDGFVVGGFDNDIDAVSVLFNDTGFSISLAHTARELLIDLDGSNRGGATGITISVQFVDPAAVPEPSSAALAIVALGMMCTRRRRG